MSEGFVVIPAYNAEETLPGVVDRIPRAFWARIAQVLIVDDGSLDKTGETARALAERNPKISVIRFGKNRGYGRAVAAGLLEAKKSAAAFAACLHADGQYAPEKLPDLLAAAREKRFDILQGSRMLPGTALAGGMPVYKYLAGRALTFLENRVFDLRMTDYHSGYLLYSRRALDTLPFDRFSASFDFDLEVIACARARGLSIGEIGIPTKYAGEISHLNPIVYGFRVLGVLGRFMFQKQSYLVLNAHGGITFSKSTCKSREGNS